MTKLLHLVGQLREEGQRKEGWREETIGGERAGRGEERGETGASPGS